MGVVIGIMSVLPSDENLCEGVSAPFALSSPKLPGTCQSLSKHLFAGGQWREAGKREKALEPTGCVDEAMGEQRRGLPHVGACLGGAGGSARWQTNSVAFWLSFMRFFVFQFLCY